MFRAFLKTHAGGHGEQNENDTFLSGISLSKLTSLSFGHENGEQIGQFMDGQLSLSQKLYLFLVGMEIGNKNGIFWPGTCHTRSLPLSTLAFGRGDGGKNGELFSGYLSFSLSIIPSLSEVAGVGGNSWAGKWYCKLHELDEKRVSDNSVAHPSTMPLVS